MGYTIRQGLRSCQGHGKTIFVDSKTKADVLKVASRGEIARRLNINLSAVSRWFSRGRIPAERVVALETITGVSRERLRPDLYVRRIGKREPTEARKAS